MVDRPAPAGVLVIRKRRLTRNQQPPPRRPAAVLVARKQAWELRDQRLQHILRLVRSLAHLHKLVLAAQQVDATAHAETLGGARALVD